MQLLINKAHNNIIFFIEQTNKKAVRYCKVYFFHFAQQRTSKTNFTL